MDNSGKGHRGKQTWPRGAVSNPMGTFESSYKFFFVVRISMMGMHGCIAAILNFWMAKHCNSRKTVMLKARDLPQVQGRLLSLEQFSAQNVGKVDEAKDVWKGNFERERKARRGENVEIQLEKQMTKFIGLTKSPQISWLGAVFNKAKRWVVLWKYSPILKWWNMLTTCLNFLNVWSNIKYLWKRRYWHSVGRRFFFYYWLFGIWMSIFGGVVTRQNWSGHQ